MPRGLLTIFGLLVCVHTWSAEIEHAVRLAPGDYKQSYQSIDYQTDSLSLALRVGKPADLYVNAHAQQLGLPAMLGSATSEPDRKRIALGRKLFFDRRLSRNKTMSCAMCHVPEQGFTSNELQRPIGANGRSLQRNAPTILNVAFYTRLFADARETSLEQQVWSPLLAHNEMDNPSVGYVVETISGLDNYLEMFQAAFADKPNMLNIGAALAQYQRALVSGNSAFDRWYYAADTAALTAEQADGFKLFMGKARCSTCHSVTDSHSLFTDNQLHSTGIGYAESMLDGVILPKHARFAQERSAQVQLAPGVSATLNQSTIDKVGHAKPNDVGRYEVTLDPKDRWKYRTSSLRNIALTAPYMHSGSLATLDEVIEFYNQGGVAHESQSPLIRPLGLSSNEQRALVAFLQSLTGANVAELVLDAFAAEVGDIKGDTKDERQ